MIHLKNLLLASILIFLSTGCAAVRLLEDYYYCCDGRPPVLMYQPKYFLDYNDCFEQFDFGEETGLIEAFQRRPITEEMFDPYQPVDPNYHLARGDILEISILGEEESIVENAMVAPDGKLYYSILNGIQAAGRRPEDVSKEIENALKAWYISPIVTITPKESKALNFYILGRVKKPGAYPFLGPTTLTEGIFGAEGLLTHASKEQDYGRRYLVPYVDLKGSFLARGNKKLDLDFEKLIDDGDQSQNIYLRPGDYIYIAPSETREIFIIGSVILPQRLPYVPDMTLLSSLATIGGFPTPNPRSPDLKRVLVIRGPLNAPRVCCIDVQKILCGLATDPVMEPGDIVYVSFKPFIFGRELILSAIYSFANAFTGSAAEYYTAFDWFLVKDDAD